MSSAPVRDVTRHRTDAAAGQSAVPAVTAGIPSISSSSSGGGSNGAAAAPAMAPTVVARTFSSAAADAISSLRFLASAFPAGSEGPRLPQFEVSTAAAVAATTSSSSPLGPRRAVPTPEAGRRPLHSGAAAATHHPARSGLQGAAANETSTATSVTALFVVKVVLSGLFLATVWALAHFGFLPSWDTVWPVVACWLPVEIFWSIYFRLVVAPRLAKFRPEDAAQPLTPEVADRVVDDVLFLIHRDPAAFWSSATGAPAAELARRRVPIATARSFVRSLFMVFPEVQDRYRHSRQQQAILDRALQRLEIASGGFDRESHGDADGGGDEFEDSIGGDNWDGGGGHMTSLSHPTLLPLPNLLRGWYDDEHLKAIIRSPPMAMILAAGLFLGLVFAVMWLFGWRRAHVDPTTGLECWVWSSGGPGCKHPPPVHPNPLVLLPGAGAGFFSFLPLAAQVQFGGAAVARGRVVLYRLPWAEVCRLRYRFPQWSAVVAAMQTSLRAAGVRGAFDLVAHSYGTVVANRFLRELCRQHDARAAARRAARQSAEQKDPRLVEGEHKDGEGDCGDDDDGGDDDTVRGGSGGRRHGSAVGCGGGNGGGMGGGQLRVDFLAMLDPIVLGSASTGIIGQINHAGPDLSFGFCCNRAGVSSLEILNYDPQASGQCHAGLAVYVSRDDTLVDIGLAHHVLRRYTQYTGNSGSGGNCGTDSNGGAVVVDNCAGGVEFVVDMTAKSFHGRWLVEMWGLGHLWGSPCATRLVDLLNPRLGLARTRAMNKLRAAMRLKAHAKLKAL